MVSEKRKAPIMDMMHKRPKRLFETVGVDETLLQLLESEGKPRPVNSGSSSTVSELLQDDEIQSPPESVSPSLLSGVFDEPPHIRFPPYQF